MHTGGPTEERCVRSGSALYCPKRQGAPQIEHPIALDAPAPRTPAPDVGARRGRAASCPPSTGLLVRLSLVGRRSPSIARRATAPLPRWSSTVFHAPQHLRLGRVVALSVLAALFSSSAGAQVCPEGPCYQAFERYWRLPPNNKRP